MELPILYKIHKQRAYTFDNLEEYNEFINNLNSNDWNISLYITPYNYSKYDTFSWPTKKDKTDFDNILNYNQTHTAVEICRNTQGMDLLDTLIYHYPLVLFFENYKDAENCYETICKDHY